MKKILFPILLIVALHAAQAQFTKQKSFNAQIGYGLSKPYNSVSNVIDDGFFAQGEWVFQSASWFALRPYIGFLVTTSNGRDVNDNPTSEKGETLAGLVGAKARVRAPIPWVAPYFEIGIGTSIGKFETITINKFIETRGLIYHIPFSFGLELGKNHNVDLGFSYYLQPTVEQLAGALAVGVTFPLKTRN